MELTLDQIHTYLHCPAEYRFKYEMGIPMDDHVSVKYKKAIHRTINYLYFSVLGGRMPTSKQMKDKWATLWAEETAAIPELSEFLLRERPRQSAPKVDKHITQGFELIHNFYHYNKDNIGIPIAVDHEFRVPVGGVTIKGNFELIKETIDKSNSNRFIEIVDFKTGNEATDMFLVNNDLNLSLMSYAFRNLFQGEEDRLTLNYIKSGKEIYTSRTEKDFDRMKAIIEGVAEGIANKRFYPRQSFMCKSCPFKEVCNLAPFN